MERDFERDLRSLDAITRYVAEFFEAAAISGENDLYVNLVIEELFTNAVKYSPEGGDVTIALTKQDGDLVIRLSDHDVEPFDVTTAPDVDTSLPVKDRRRGGLGLHLVKKIARDVTYQYVDRCSVITVKMALEA